MTSEPRKDKPPPQLQPGAIQHPFKFSIFTKIVFGLVLVILFMLLAGVQILLKLGGTSAIDQSEFRISTLTQELLDRIEQEHSAAKKYIETGDSYDAQFVWIMSKGFTGFLDSLINVVRDPAVTSRELDTIRILVSRVDEQHRRYDTLFANEVARVKREIRAPSASLVDSLAPLRVSVVKDLRAIHNTVAPLVAKSLKKYRQQTVQPLGTAYWILALAFCVALVSGLLLARTVTRPIQSLKAGTQKVGEGVYETVPVTTTDEIADLTRAFNLMSEKLRQLDEMRMQMMSEISHEMRTPLQVIKAGCYSIIHAKDGTPLAPRQRDAVGMIHQATNRINQFVNSFLDVAKMEAGLMKFRFEEADLIEVLNPLVQEAQLIAQTRQINIGFEATEIPSLSLDKERISQVFSNLLSNALKYTPDGGSITVCVSHLESCDGLSPATGRGCVQVEVKDSGVGIPESDLAKLFNKFYQAKNVPLVNEKGSGLGLALVKHVSEAHGGRVSVTSKVGSGSTFSVVLPA